MSDRAGPRPRGRSCSSCASCIETARTMPMSASVLVNRDEALALRRRRARRAPRGAAPGPLAAEGARRVPRAGPPRRRRHHRRRRATQAERMVERTEIAREARRAAAADRRPTPRPTPAGSATRPRTTSTGSSRAFEVVLDRTHAGRAARAASGSRSTSAAMDAEDGADDADDGRRSSTRTSALTGRPSRPGQTLRTRSADRRCYPGCRSAACRASGAHARPPLAPAAAGRRRARMSGLRIDVADLLRHPGARRDVTVVEAASTTSAAPRRAVDGPVDGRRSRSSGSPTGIVVRGERRRPLGGASAASACATSSATLDRPRRRALRARRRSRARPTRSRATRSTSSSWSATRVLLELPARAALRRAAARAAADPASPIDDRLRPTRRPDPRWARALPRSSSETPTPRSHRWPSRSARPRGRKTHSRRSANRQLDAPARSLCPNCGAAKLPHIVCGNCGWYHGRQVVDVD